ncbi:putative DNA modification/repair radical SAM protein [Kushneria aurantia]|uniref:DNA modification/repair radical SAM protein n=1 Tax=Kushneria aurantia TaxID=504092 RepID=A0ABV6G516_9GAMM|nr:putative DNA modification/repair radical SAM protein [Kushneria aurantia]
MELADKLIILADAAKYDASCASSGAPRRSSKGREGLGATNGTGICHSFTPDGRCVSLLKILMTNFCLYDCQYCINRRSSNVPRARFSVDEIIRLTLDFYRRNTISGLFLSSGIIRSSDYTMEALVRVAKTLRLEHNFRGYIHLKTIAEASPELIRQAGLYADRLSVNVELPTVQSLEKLAPEKSEARIHGAMGTIRDGLGEADAEPRAPRFSPSGQSTQMIVGADTVDDHTILGNVQRLYRDYRLKRVYYSAFSPIPESPGTVPHSAPPLLREHRLYQADFLMRSYGFRADELLDGPGNLSLEIDPKLGWALRHREHFPVDLDRAETRMIARVPGIGLRSAQRIVALRRERHIRYDDLVRLGCSMKKLAPFITTGDYRPRDAGLDNHALRARLAPPPAQMPLL